MPRLPDQDGELHGGERLRRYARRRCASLPGSTRASACRDRDDPRHRVRRQGDRQQLTAGTSLMYNRATAHRTLCGAADSAPPVRRPCSRRRTRRATGRSRSFRAASPRPRRSGHESRSWMRQWARIVASERRTSCGRGKSELCHTTWGHVCGAERARRYLELSRCQATGRSRLKEKRVLCRPRSRTGAGAERRHQPLGDREPQARGRERSAACSGRSPERLKQRFLCEA